MKYVGLKKPIKIVAQFLLPHVQAEFRSSQRGKNVRMKGLEPPHLSILEPKSSASTNSATSANSRDKFKYLEILLQESNNHSYGISIISSAEVGTPSMSNVMSAILFKTSNVLLRQSPFHL
jgi:hypothetical protein